MRDHRGSTRLNPAALGGISVLLVVALALAGGWSESVSRSKLTSQRTSTTQVERAAAFVRIEKRSQSHQQERPPTHVQTTDLRRAIAFAAEVPARLPMGQAATMLAPWRLDLPPPAMIW